MRNHLVSSVFLCSWISFIVCQSDEEKAPAFGYPLFLTPLIESGNLTEAKTRSTTRPLKGSVKSYSGFLTVDKRYNSNLFFWYFPAEKSREKAPVILWLQNEPFVSGLSGVFYESGPYYVKVKRGLGLRKFYWSQKAHVIYVDSPVGTGFSFSEEQGYSTNQTSIGNNLYEMLLQLFTIYSEMRSLPFYIMGEGFGGKTAGVLASIIHLKNPSSVYKIHLKGIAIGNSMCNPAIMLDYSSYLYSLGLIDLNGRSLIQQQEKSIADLLKRQNYKEAFNKFNMMIKGDLNEYPTLFRNLTNFNYYSNYLHDRDDRPYGSYKYYIQKDIVRKALHVGNLTFVENKQMGRMLINDVMKSIDNIIPPLLTTYRILVYAGQMNIIVPYRATVDFLNGLKWNGAAQYKTKRRQSWLVDNEIAGYSKQVLNLTELLVRNAGYSVAYDQPKWALDMMNRFTSNQPF